MQKKNLFFGLDSKKSAVVIDEQAKEKYFYLILFFYFILLYWKIKMEKSKNDVLLPLVLCLLLVFQVTKYWGAI